MNDTLLYLYAETSVHAGAEASSGVIDSPIQREAGTGYPVIWGQSLKGALRAHAYHFLDETVVEHMFGSAVDFEGVKRQGSIAVGDAQIVGFPVHTVVNTFAWVTSTIALSRLERKRRRTGLPPVSRLPEDVDTGLAPPAGLTGRMPRWSATAEIFGASETSLAADEATGEWAALLAGEALPTGAEFARFRDKFATDLITLAASDFSDDLDHDTEALPRIALERDTKTIQPGAYFNTEYLPSDTLLAATVSLRTQEDRDRFVTLFGDDAAPLQVGGDETIGKGLTWVRIVEGEHA